MQMGYLIWAMLSIRQVPLLWDVLLSLFSIFCLVYVLFKNVNNFTDFEGHHQP